MDAVAFAVAVCILAEPHVSEPVPLILDRPALPHQAQQRFGAGAQGGDVDAVGRRP